METGKIRNRTLLNASWTLPWDRSEWGVVSCPRLILCTIAEWLPTTLLHQPLPYPIHKCHTCARATAISSRLTWPPLPICWLITLCY